MSVSAGGVAAGAPSSDPAPCQCPQAVSSDPAPCQCPQAVSPSARLPATLQEFGREWRRLEVGGRLTLLRRMGAAALGHVLRAEIPAGLLGEVLHTLLAFSPSTPEVRLVVEVLQAMSEANRSVVRGRCCRPCQRPTGQW